MEIRTILGRKANKLEVERKGKSITHCRKKNKACICLTANFLLISRSPVCIITIIANIFFYAKRTCRTKGNRAYFASEESAIRIICPDPEKVWSVSGAEPVFIPLEIDDEEVED